MSGAFHSSPPPALWFLFSAFLDIFANGVCVVCGVWGRAVAHSTGSAEAELGGGGVGTVRVVASSACGLCTGQELECREGPGSPDAQPECDLGRLCCLHLNQS